MSEPALIETCHDGDVARIELQRHDRRNALNIALCLALRHEVEAAATSARCIVITGQGTSFCAGADLDGVYGDEFLQALYGMLHALQSTDIPLIAAVNGPAIGAGTQLAMACDLRFLDETAKFAVPTARNAMAVDTWTIRRLRSLIGAGRAARILLAADTIGPADAMEWGLADYRGDVDAAMSFARDIACLAPLSLGYTKMVLNETADESTLDAAFERVWSSADINEAARARAEKRAPEFSGA